MPTSVHVNASDSADADACSREGRQREDEPNLRAVKRPKSSAAAANNVADASAPQSDGHDGVCADESSAASSRPVPVESSGPIGTGDLDPLNNLDKDRPASDTAGEVRRRPADRGDSKGRHPSWGRRFDELKQYLTEHGSCNVPSGWSENQQLANWVISQRKYYHRREDGKKSPLTADRVAVLEGVGFQWRRRAANPKSRAAIPWETHFRGLEQYKAQNGHCRIPRSWGKNITLATWVASQRVLYRNREKGKKPSITTERAEALKKIGFEWTRATSPTCVPWGTRYTELKQYKAMHGNCIVPRHPNASPLSRWVHWQRAQYRLFQQGKRSTISAERIEQLRLIDFEWAVNDPDSWGTRFKELLEFRGRHGNCDVPSKEQPQLFRWLGRQRYQYRRLKEGKKSEITEERISRLESISFDWSALPNTGGKRAKITSLRSGSKIGDTGSFLATPTSSGASGSGIGGTVVSIGGGAKKKRKRLPLPSTGPQMVKISRRLASNDHDTGSPPATLTLSHARESAGSGSFLATPTSSGASDGDIGGVVASIGDGAKEKRTGVPLPSPGPQMVKIARLASTSKGHDTGSPPATSSPSRARESAGSGGATSKRTVAAKGGHKKRRRKREEHISRRQSESEKLRTAEAKAAEIESKWQQSFGELKEYSLTNGHCKVPSRYKHSKVALGTWVLSQRQQYRLFQAGTKSSMTRERIAELESAGFDWAPRTGREPNAGLWQKRYDELQSYKAEHNSCNVPLRNHTENPQLARWVDTQRRQYQLLQEGKSSDLTRDRIELLERIGFHWTLRGRWVSWEDRFGELQLYQAEHGDCRVPKGWEENPKLAMWVREQRNQHRILQQGNQAHSITEERIEKLERLGFEWSLLSMKVENAPACKPRRSRRRKFVNSERGKGSSAHSSSDEGSIVDKSTSPPPMPPLDQGNENADISAAACILLEFDEGGTTHRGGPEPEPEVPLTEV